MASSESISSFEFDAKMTTPIYDENHSSVNIARNHNEK